MESMSKTPALNQLLMMCIGSIITVAPGRMRNAWYPNQWAEYVTPAQLKELGLEGSVMGRDSTFGVGQDLRANKPEEDEHVETEPEVIKVDMGLLSVSCIVDLLSSHYITACAEAFANTLGSLNAH